MAPAIQLGRTRMLRDMVPRWNVQQAHNAHGVYSLPPVRRMKIMAGHPALVAQDVIEDRLDDVRLGERIGLDIF